MKYLSLWVFILTLGIGGCSAKEPTESASTPQQMDNNALTTSTDEIQAAKPPAKPIKVAQATSSLRQTTQQAQTLSCQGWIS